ncbi:hypothetical protein COU59_00220 [Candidatus Pacearchaeota archaeon CG10_big_fil_rev_8_21_14_0_10_34_12]|nr:MAG: hypothetical protein COU59_00220 [Candidatus Pacearchaeota archaeon CG10_big_fil_rev_8_21_14_0_10_34_12]
MRCSSVGLEVFLKVSEDEFSGLENESIKGDIQFYGVGEDIRKRKIPFELRYNPEQREFLKVEKYPLKDVYFGNLDRVTFLINEDFYKEVKEHGFSGDRFFTGGKFSIAIENRYEPY